MSDSEGFPLGKVLKTAIWAAVADKITLPSYLRCAELLALHGECFVNSDAVITALTFATCPVDGVRKALLGGDLKGGLIALLASLLVGWHNGKARKDRLERLKHQAVRLPGDEAVWRRADLPNGELMSSCYDDSITVYHNFFVHAQKRYASEPCLGTRTPSGYVWESYEATAQRATAFGSGLLEVGLTPGDKFGIYSANSAEWVLAELGGGAYGLVNVALYAVWGEDAVQYVINHSEIKAVVCSLQTLNSLLLALPHTPGIKTVIYMDGSSSGKAPNEEQMKTLIAAGVSVYPFSYVESQGVQHPKDHIVPKPTDLGAMLYTSGTTGNPKGVMLTHASMVANTSSYPTVIGGSGVSLGPGDRHISFLPLAHIFERGAMTVMFMQGVGVGFYSGRVETLADDFGALKPTIVFGVPRVFSRIYDAVLHKVSAASKTQQALFHLALKEGTKVTKAGGGFGKLPFWNKLVFNKVRARLGGACRLVVSGGAPLSSDAQNFLQVALGCPVIQGYGLTETNASGAVAVLEDCDSGHVGGPSPCLDIMLDPVPEMDYLPTDKPFPRGEICMRGYAIFSGYFKDEEKTKEAIDEHGWFHTGDIGQINDNGTLTIIDRKKNIFKLAQGEYVAAEKLENVFAKAPLVSQIFVYGDSFKSSLVAVVVPEPVVLRDWVVEKGIKSREEADVTPVDQLIELPGVLSTVLDQIKKEGKAAELKGFEFVKAVKLDAEAFAVENGLMTPTFKLCRPKLKNKYKGVIDQLYATLEG